MKDFVEFVAKGLVDKPEDVQVVEVEGEQGAVLELRVAKEDLGKVIGQAGPDRPCAPYAARRGLFQGPSSRHAGNRGVVRGGTAQHPGRSGRNRHARRPHGIRGEIRVNYYADSLELLRGDVVYLQAGNKPPRKMEIDTVRMHQGTPLIRFVEAPDRTAAEFLRGQTLLIPESALPELDEDEVYLHDMLGLSVVLDATGQKLGVLDHVLFHGEQELWSILTPEGKDILLPAVPEFVADIDLDTEIIRITPPEGLLELYM